MTTTLLLFARYDRAVSNPTTAGLRCCLRFITAPSWKGDSGLVVPFAAATIRSINSVADGSHQEELKDLRKDIRSYPSGWGDTRLDKENPLHPQFRQKLLRECLWMTTGRPTSGAHLKNSSCDTVSTSGEEIRRLCKEGQLDRALILRIDQQGNVPSVNMYKSLLRACAERRALLQAKRVHAHLVEKGLESTGCLGEHVVSTLVKCGSLEDAFQVFKRLQDRTVFSWTAVISGYTNSGQGEEAIRLYRRMQQDGVQPNEFTFVSLLRACGSIADLETGRHIHAEAARYRCEVDIFVCTCLIDMYGKCGSIVDAQNVFDGLGMRNVVSWTAILSAYAQQGQAERVLQLYEQMREEGVSPDARTFVMLLQGCGMLAEKEDKINLDGQCTKIRSLVQGKAMHAEARTKGYDLDLFVGSTLVSMYGKCGSIVDAETVFNGLHERNVVAWTAMLSASAHLPGAGKALQLYEQMREENVSPNTWTFVSALQACGMFAEMEEYVFLDYQPKKVEALQKVKAIHSDALSKGYDSDAFIGNTLISVYGKCGSIVDADNVFDGLSEKNVVAWTALLAAHAQQGHGAKALQVYEQMLEEGVIPTIRTFASTLQACAIFAESEPHSLLHGKVTKLESMVKGKAMHADTWRKGYDSDICICSSLISMYGKCGSIVDAQNVFDSLSHQGVMAWNALLSAYADHGRGDNALHLYRRMREEGVSPDNWTFVSALQSCGKLAESEGDVSFDGYAKLKYLHKSKAIYADAYTKGYKSDVFIGSSVISLYGKCGSILDADNVFDGLSEHNMVAWNAMLGAYVQAGEANKALQLYERMLLEGVNPDPRTFVCVLQACGMAAESEDEVVLQGRSTKVKSLEKGKAIHAGALRQHVEFDAFVGNTLVSMYGKCGSTRDAQHVFDGLSERSVVSWNAMVAAYAQQGEAGMALQLYSQMQWQGVSPDEVTIVGILRACSNTGGLAICRKIHHDLLLTGYDLSRLLENTLVHTYGRCASMDDAQTFFDALLQPDVVAWTALIAGYSRQGNYESSLNCYKEMQLAGVKPNEVTFLSLLSACSHAGLVGKGVEYFASMTGEHGITPTIEHYVCMVDLLGRAGCFERIQDLLSTMPIQPNLAIWLCLLGACRKHGKVVLGKMAFDCAVALEPKHSAAYVLMSNIYADAGLSHDGNQVKKSRQKEYAWKKPGQSWIEHDQDMHMFVVGDKKHQQQQQLYDLVELVSLDLKQDSLYIQEDFREIEESFSGHSQIALGLQDSVSAVWPGCSFFLPEQLITIRISLGESADHIPQDRYGPFNTRLTKYQCL